VVKSKNIYNSKWISADILVPGYLGHHIDDCTLKKKMAAASSKKKNAKSGIFDKVRKFKKI